MFTTTTISRVLGLTVAGFIAKKLVGGNIAAPSNFVKKLNWVSDVTNMDARPVDKIFFVKNVDDISSIIKLAKKNKKQISIRGQAHTMGGHSFSENNLLIDIKYMNRIIDFDCEKQIVTVEPGILWSDLIRFLNEYGLSPMTLQSYSSFSVGGSISVNAHGITNDYGVCESIVNIRYIDASNSEVYCSRDVNAEVFSKIIGGYGLFGIINEVTLRVVPNVGLSMKNYCFDIDSFCEKFLAAIDDPNINIKLGRINIVNFDEIFMYLFYQNPEKQNIISELDKNPHEMTKVSQLMYKWLIPTRKGQKIRYGLEKTFKKPLDWSDDCERNKLLYESATPMGNLYNPLIVIDRTHILQEFFIPNARFKEWMYFLKNTFVGASFNKISLLNITVRYVKEDHTTFLRYAKDNMFAFVFYYRVERHELSNIELEALHNVLVEEVLRLKGTFYLPYRHHYSRQQLQTAYPEINDFYQAKLHFDPECLFTNMWYEHYSPKFHYADDMIYSKKIIQNFHETSITSNNCDDTHLLQPVDNQSNNQRNSYQMIFSSDILKYKFKEFLKNIFYLVPPEELFGVVSAINPQTSDIGVFNIVQQHMSSMGFVAKIKNKFRTLRILGDQRKDFVGQLKNISNEIGRNGYNGYVSIGDAGRNVNLMKSQLNITGNVYIVHDKQSMMDIVERGSIRSVGTFVQFDYNNSTSININDNSVDLVTCLMGLHHFPIENLQAIIRSIHKILRVNGLFVIREHDAYPELVPILNAAHNNLNAVTGETLENETEEIRQFRQVNEWIRIIEAIGFTDVGVYEMQKNDTTEDFMLCFRKNETIEEKAKNSIAKFIANTKEKYERGLDQTYSTLTEWYLVDVAQKFGKFMETSPYYLFSYWNTICLFWTLWYREAKIIRQKCGIRKAYFSEYTIASLVMGTTVTMIFSLMSILSFIPRMIYTSPTNADASKISLMVIHGDANLEKIDDQITVLNSRPFTNNQTLSLIRVPRYLKFMDIAIKLATSNVKFYEICGQKEIQVKISVAKNDSDTISALKNLDGIEILFNYCILPQDTNNEVALSVKIAKLDKLLNYCSENKIEILHIYDY